MGLHCNKPPEMLLLRSLTLVPEYSNEQVQFHTTIQVESHVASLVIFRNAHGSQTKVETSSLGLKSTSPLGTQRVTNSKMGSTNPLPRPWTYPWKSPL